MPEKFIRSKAQNREDFQRVPPLHSQSLDLSSLTEQEERIIQAVIQKDELERSILDAKISEVRKEIQELRKAGALTSGDNQNAICARCKYKFPSFIMPLADHGQRCVSCKFRVCKKCSSREPSGMWLCVLCLKYRQEKLLTGEWMSKGESIGLQGSDLLRVSLRDRNPSSHRKLPVVTKKTDVVLAVKKNKVSETVKLFQQRRDSYTHAVENQRATVAAPKELVRDSDSSVTSNNTSKSNTPDPRLQQQQRNHADQQRSRTEQQKTAPEQPKVKPEQQKTVQEQPKARSEQQKAGQESQKSTEQQKVRLKSLAEQQLQVPAIAVTQSGDEQREEDDDLDELFGNHRPQLLGSRSSLADSRESIYSVYSDAGEVNYGKIPVTGDIFFNLNYNVKSSALEIHIKQCRNLAPVDTKHGRSDPYIKTYLLPDKTRSSKRKTKIKKHTLNPTFDEVLKYSITPAELESRTLWVTVWHNDRFGRNDFLGEVTIPLDYYRFDENAPRWYPLQERSMSQESESPVLAYKGDLFISLKYIPADMVDNAPKKKSGSFRKKSKEKEKPKAGLGEVHVLVREAQNLTAMRANAGSNPFCKGYLLPDVSRSSKQKTPVIKKTTNPQWNHILVFEGVDQSQLQQHGLELTVWDHEKLSSNDFLGGVRLNLGQGTHQGKPVDWMDAKGEEIEAWQSMMEHPNEWIDAQLPLRASMGKQNVKK